MYLASSPYLPKYKIRAAIVLKDGDVYEGHVFVTGDQRISDLLKVPNPFLAFESLNGTFHLFNRKTIMRVIPKESEEERVLSREYPDWRSASGADWDATDEAAEHDAVREGFSEPLAEAVPGAAPALAVLAAGVAKRRVLRLGRLTWAPFAMAGRQGSRAGASLSRLRRTGAAQHAGRYTAVALLLLCGLALGLAVGPMLIAESSPEQRLADYGRAMRAYAQRDYAAAVPELEELAEQGMAQAQFQMGAMHSQGEGVPRDYAKALSWHHRAAERGHAGAQTAIGVIYRNGLGVRQDYGLAYMWFALGAANGDAAAVALRQEVGYKMSYEQIAEAERRVQDWQSRHGG